MPEISQEEYDKLKADAAKAEAATAELDTWKGHSRDWEKRAKDNKTELDELKTKLQQPPAPGTDDAAVKAANEELLKRIADLESHNKALSVEKLRTSAIAAAGLNPAAAQFISAETEEEIKTQVEAFKSLVPAAPAAGTGHPAPPAPPGYQGAPGDSDKKATLEDGANLYKQKHGK